MKDFATLFEQAARVRLNAYAPYSNFLVGACIETTSGACYVGCNVENASYGLTTCAEANAISAMIAAGEKEIKQIVIVVAGPIATPCGGCRQRLSEFAFPDTLVHLADLNANQKTFTVTELIPYTFGPKDLKKRRANT